MAGVRVFGLRKWTDHPASRPPNSVDIAGRRLLGLASVTLCMAEDEHDREQGVNFTSIDPVIEDLSYPVTTGELVDQHGDHAIKRTNAEPITIAELFDSIGEDTFESAEEVRQSILGVMPEDSVGREGYSDRGGSLPGDSEDESM